MYARELLGRDALGKIQTDGSFGDGRELTTAS